MASCIFCNGGTSKEHITSEWMRRECGLTNTKFRMGFGLENEKGEMDTVTQPQYLSNFYTMNVCGLCNNGWMSRLENKVKPVLSPFLKDAWPANDLEIFRSLFVHSGTLARWLLKTACKFGAKMSVEVPDSVRSRLYRDLVPSELSVDMAYNEEPGFYMGMSREWSVCKDGMLHTMRLGNQSFRLTWQVNHLVMRVSYFPGCEKRMEKPRFPVNIYPKFEVMPDYKDDGVVKRSYCYDTLEQMEHETVYFYRN